MNRAMQGRILTQAEIEAVEQAFTRLTYVVPLTFTVDSSVDKSNWYVIDSQDVLTAKCSSEVDAHGICAILNAMPHLLATIEAQRLALEAWVRWQTDEGVTCTRSEAIKLTKAAGVEIEEKQGRTN